MGEAIDKWLVVLRKYEELSGEKYNKHQAMAGLMNLVPPDIANELRIMLHTAGSASQRAARRLAATWMPQRAHRGAPARRAGRAFGQAGVWTGGQVGYGACAHQLGVRGVSRSVGLKSQWQP